MDFVLWWLHDGLPQRRRRDTALGLKSLGATCVCIIKCTPFISPICEGSAIRRVSKHSLIEVSKFVHCRMTISFKLRRIQITGTFNSEGLKLVSCTWLLELWRIEARRQLSRYFAKLWCLNCFGCTDFTYSCTQLVDYPESSVPLVSCILKSCLECVSIMPLAQRPSFQVFANMISRMLSGRLSAQCAATSFSRCVFTTFFARPVVNAWNILKDLQSLDLNVKSSSRCHYVFSCFQKPCRMALVFW